MTKLIAVIRRDLADPFGSAISVALIAALVTLLVIGALAVEAKYLDHYPSIRQVNAEDDCMEGTEDVRRIGEHLYCIGEPNGE